MQPRTGNMCLGILAVWTGLGAPHTDRFKNVVELTVAVPVGEHALRPGKVDPHHEVVVTVKPHNLPPMLDNRRRASAGNGMNMLWFVQLKSQTATSPPKGLTQSRAVWPERLSFD